MKTRTAAANGFGVGLIALLALLTALPEDVSAAPDRAVAAYRDGEFDDAVALYSRALGQDHDSPSAVRDAQMKRNPERRAKLAFGLGAAAYKSAEFGAATEAFGESLLSPDAAMQERAHYNLGNSLFRRGEAALKAAQENFDPEGDPAAAVAPVVDDWENAIEHYDAALAIEPGNEDAQFNKEVVEKQLEQLQQAVEQQQQQQGQQGEGEEGDGEPGGDEEGGEGEEGDGSNGGQPGEGDEGDENEGGEKGGEQGEGNPDKDFENPMKKGAGEGDDRQGQDFEGKLEAKEDGGSPEGGQRDSKLAPADRQVNPETGFSKHQARQLLRAYADEETQTRPPVRTPVENDYKNW